MSLIDQASIDAAQRRAQLANENVQLRNLAQTAMQRLAGDCQTMFSAVWERGEREQIQEFLDTFSPQEQQTMFASHAAAMQLLATWYPEFRPQLPPFEFTWSANGIVIGEKKDQPA